MIPTRKDLGRLLTRVGFEAYDAKDSKGKPCIMVRSTQGTALGDIESEMFYTPEDVVDRMSIYWEGEFLVPGMITSNGFGSFEAALCNAVDRRDPDDIWALARIIPAGLDKVWEMCLVSRVSVLFIDALRHVDAMHDANRLTKLEDGNYVVYMHDVDGWVRISPTDLASKEMDRLDHIDFIREVLAKDAHKLPQITGILLHRSLYHDETINFTGKTALGEPQVFMDLMDGSSVEITHEEEGLSAGEQYFSVRHHCSDAEFDKGAYEDTCGVITQTCGNLSEIAEEIKRLVNFDMIKALDGV